MCAGSILSWSWELGDSLRLINDGHRDFVARAAKPN